MTARPWKFGLTLAFAACAAWAGGSADSPPEAAPPPADVATASAETAPSPDGLKVYLDPLTGAFVDRPSAEQRRALESPGSDALRRDADDLEPFYLLDGGRGVFLRGRFQNAVIARRTAAGGLEISCVDRERADGEVEAVGEPERPAAAEVR